MIGAGELAQDAAEREWECMSDDERAALEADIDDDAAYYAALMAEAEAAQAAHIAAEDERIAGALVQVGPYTYADPQCRQCRGTGVVTDIVDWGSTTANLESPCDCQVDYEWAVTDGDGIAITQGAEFWTRRDDDGLYVLVSSINAPKVVYSTAAALLDMCAIIAPLSAWGVVWDDMGADDAPRY